MPYNDPRVQRESRVHTIYRIAQRAIKEVAALGSSYRLPQSSAYPVMDADADDTESEITATAPLAVSGNNVYIDTTGASANDVLAYDGANVDWAAPTGSCNWTRTGTVLRTTVAADDIELRNDEHIYKEDKTPGGRPFFRGYLNGYTPGDYPIFKIQANGYLYWGDGGSSVFDTAFGRTGVGELTLDNATHLWLQTYLKFTDQGSDPAAPSSGYPVLYTKSGQLYLRNSSGVVGPFGAGGTHDLLSATHSDTTAAACAAGSLICGTYATPSKWANLAVGNPNDLLQVQAITGPAWNAPINVLNAGLAAGSGISLSVGATQVTIASTSPFTLVTKSANQNKTSDTVIAADTALQLTASAASWYLFRGKIFYTTGASGDFKWSLLAAQTIQGAYGKYNYIIPGALTTEVHTSLSGSLPSAIAMAGSGTTGGWVEFDFVVNTHASNSGLLSFAWAQNTSDGTNTTVLTGSYIEYYKFA